VLTASSGSGITFRRTTIDDQQAMGSKVAGEHGRHGGRWADAASASG
jgi:hypothetical protein